MLLSEFRPARPEDLAEVVTLLGQCDLPTRDLTAGLMSHFLLATDGSTLQVCVGLEPFGDVGLLRSLAVDKERRSNGLGRAALRAIESSAARAGVRHLYLLTMTAASFFEEQGYLRTDRAAAPAVLKDTHEFASLCPASATCMVKRLNAPPSSAN